MNQTILVIDNECNIKKITEVEFNNFILPFGWAYLARVN